MLYQMVRERVGGIYNKRWSYTSDLTQGNSRLSKNVTVKTKSHEVLEETMGNSLITMD